MFRRILQNVVMAAVAMLGWAGAHPHAQNPAPAISITTVPTYGTSGDMRGVVTGIAGCSGYAVAPYIYIDGSGWWSKPSFSARTVPVNANCTFSATVTTGGNDQVAVILCAALVPAGSTPPLADGTGRIPAALAPVALDCRERPGRVLSWAGRNWAVKDATLPAGPGGFRFSSAPSDVWVDAEGLHLSLHFHDGAWWSTEVYLLDQLGYGTYTFKTRSRNDVLDVNAVFGAFLYDSFGDDTSGASPTREIDAVEDSRWGAHDGPNTQAVVQPYEITGNRHPFSLPNLSANAQLTRTFSWSPDTARFRTLRGNQCAGSYDNASLVNDWSYSHDPSARHYIPRTSRERVHMNLWLNGVPPSDNQPVEIVITDFSFADGVTSTPMISVDAPFNGAVVAPSFSVSGWALDRGSVTGTGVDFVVSYAVPPSGPPILLGVSTLGQPRADVAAVYGACVAGSGFRIDATAIPPGMYTVATYLHSAVTQKYSPGAFVNVVVTASDSRMVLDAPAAGAVATQPSRGGGWTLDRGATTGTGIDAVHIWAFPVWAGGLGPGRFVGLAQLGIARPDISAVFGSQFAGAGFEFAIAGLPPGQYVITAYAHSVVTGTFSQQTSALVSLQ